MRSDYIFNKQLTDPILARDARKMIDDIKSNYNLSDSTRQEVDQILNFLGSAETYVEVPVGLVDSSNTEYALKHIPLDPARAEITIDGRFQEWNVDYNIYEHTLIFVIPPATNSELKAKYKWWREKDLAPRPFAGIPIGSVGSPANLFHLPQKPQDPESLMVLMDGIAQQKGVDYIYDGEYAIQFISPGPVSRTELFVYFDHLNQPSPFTIPIQEAPPETPGPGVLEFTMSYLPKHHEGVVVKLNGGVQYFQLDFYIEGNKVVFKTAPAVNTLIDIYYNTSISGELAMTRVKFTELLDKFALHPFLLMGG